MVMRSFIVFSSGATLIRTSADLSESAEACGVEGSQGTEYSQLVHDPGSIFSWIAGERHGERVGYLFRLLGIFDVEFNKLNPRIRSSHLFQRTFAPSRDDDLVAFPMQRFSETAPDA
jgi:hypothetical protein